MKANLERSVAERRRELMEAGNEMDAFSYSVSHDLQAPLRSLGGFARLLSEEYGALLDSRGRDYLQRITGATEHMRALIEDLMRLSQVASVQLSRLEVDLSQMVRSIVDELQQHEPDRVVQIRIGDKVTGHADPSLLRIALHNLLANAWKFTRRKDNAYIEFGAVPGSQSAYFIRDNGADFDPEVATDMFAPFRRFHSEADFPGTGVGLSIVQRVIARHGGEITATGAVGEGAMFTFSL